MYYKTEKDSEGNYATVKSEAPIDASGGSGGNAYAWVHWTGTVLYLNCDVPPNDPTTIRSISKDDLRIEDFWNEYMSAWNVNSDTSFSYMSDNREMVYNRDPTQDISIWDADPYPRAGLYCWQNSEAGRYVYTLVENPTSGSLVIYKPFEDYMEGKELDYDGNGLTQVTNINNDTITIDYLLDSNYNTFVRYPDGDWFN